MKKKQRSPRPVVERYQVFPSEKGEQILTRTFTTSAKLFNTSLGAAKMLEEKVW